MKFLAEIDGASKLKQDASNRLVSDTEKETWNGKQNALTFDSTPKASSTNPVTSEGIKTALDGKVDNNQVLTNVPADAIFTDTITTINGKTGTITKADITALGIPSQDTTYGLFSTTTNGLVPKTTTSNTTDYLRRDGTWATPPDTNTIYTHPSTHPASMITGLPTSLPADGGDADTVDGKHASDFAISGHTHAYAPTSHDHGNIKSGGTITATVVTPANTDYLLISDTSNSGKIERGITIGTATSTYLRNDGTWGTPTNTTYSAISTSEIDAGTSTTSRTITAQRLKYATDKVGITLGTTQPTSGWWFKEI